MGSLSETSRKNLFLLVWHVEMSLPGPAQVRPSPQSTVGQTVQYCIRMAQSKTRPVVLIQFSPKWHDLWRTLVL